jgi:hypothetical protein
MQVHLVKPEEEGFEELQRWLQRELTPNERRWLRLADQFLAKWQKDYRTATIESMAA